MNENVPCHAIGSKSRTEFIRSQAINANGSRPAGLNFIRPHRARSSFISPQLSILRSKDISRLYYFYRNYKRDQSSGILFPLQMAIARRTAVSRSSEGIDFPLAISRKNSFIRFRNIALFHLTRLWRIIRAFIQRAFRSQLFRVGSN